MYRYRRGSPSGAKPPSTVMDTSKQQQHRHNKRRRKKTVASTRRSASIFNILRNFDKTSLIILMAATSVLVSCTVMAALKVCNSLFFLGDDATMRGRQLNAMEKFTRAQSYNNNNNAGDDGDDSDDGEADDYSQYPYGMDVLDWNPIYRIPESMELVGDRSDDYVRLRQAIDPVLPEDGARSLQLVQELTAAQPQYSPFRMKIDLGDQVLSYDIYNCPDDPPAGYPYQWNILKILENWPADDATPRPQIYQGLCVFDYLDDYQKAITYREAELPFLVVNDPAVARTVERWNVPGYLDAMLGPTVEHRGEYSENNHFMYFVKPPQEKRRRRRAKQTPKDWHPPTENIRLTYQEWLQHANVSDDQLGPDMPHWYFRLIGCGSMGNDGSCDDGSSEYLYDELPYFQPKESLYIVDPSETQGIHCRFGMKGVVAENHFDSTRNAIVLLGGQRRYVLSHPNQCANLALYPNGHPSARHSKVNWADPDLDKFPEFAHATANEVILRPGQVLYLPTNWFHFIVSLDLNFQCNTRSGQTDTYPLDSCGFPYTK